jgi:uncharacterized protein
MNAQQNADSWRVAALSMMNREELAALLGNDPRDAAPWVGAAARLGIPEAQIRLARMLLAGEGVEKNDTAAFAWFARAAEAGNSEAQNMLGRCCENGWGVAPCPSLAAVWYARAAEAGDAWAQYNLGHLLLDGNGVARDRDAAFLWYRRAADQGHPRAMSLVGRCFEEGWGTEHDPIAALEWYRRSAEGGYFRGAFNFASILAVYGCDDEAVRWFDRAQTLAPSDKREMLMAAWRRLQRDRRTPPRSPLRTQAARA